MDHGRTLDALSTGASNNREKKLQEMGQKLVSNLYVFIRSLKLYEADNKIFLRPLHHLEEIINGLIARERKVQLYGHTSTIYLNEVMIPFSVSSLSNVDFLLDAFERHGMGGILIEQPVTVGHLKDFLSQFAPENEGQPSQVEGELLIKGESIEEVRSRLKELSYKEITTELTLKADAGRYTVLLYCRLLQYVQQLFDPGKSAPKSYIATRTLQEFIDLSSKQKVNFLGFTSDADEHAYEVYHVANTTFASILFGQYLGLTRLQLLDLGLAALQHNIGKLEISPAILDKPYKFGKSEQQEIRRIPLYTVKKILDGPFDWKRLQYAIIAADVKSPDYTSSHPDRIAEEGPWLYSRIIELSSIFDALCSRRPFRKKMHPADALVFMRHHLKKRRDPYLLKHFIKFFGSTITQATQQSIDWSKKPKDLREWGHKKMSKDPLGRDLKKEMQEYWELRRLPKLTPEQEHRLKFLKRFLAWKSKTQKNASS